MPMLVLACLVFFINTTIQKFDNKRTMMTASSSGKHDPATKTAIEEEKAAPLSPSSKVRWDDAALHQILQDSKNRKEKEDRGASSSRNANTSPKGPYAKRRIIRSGNNSKKGRISKFPKTDIIKAPTHLKAMKVKSNHKLPLKPMEPIEEEQGGTKQTAREKRKHDAPANTKKKTSEIQIKTENLLQPPPPPIKDGSASKDDQDDDDSQNFSIEVEWAIGGGDKKKKKQHDTANHSFFSCNDDTTDDTTNPTEGITEDASMSSTSSSTVIPPREKKQESKKCLKVDQNAKPSKKEKDMSNPSTDSNVRLSQKTSNNAVPKNDPPGDSKHVRDDSNAPKSPKNRKSWLFVSSKNNKRNSLSNVDDKKMDPPSQQQEHKQEEENNNGVDNNGIEVEYKERSIRKFSFLSRASRRFGTVKLTKESESSQDEEVDPDATATSSTSPKTSETFDRRQDDGSFNSSYDGSILRVDPNVNTEYTETVINGPPIGAKNWEPKKVEHSTKQKSKQKQKQVQKQNQNEKQHQMQETQRDQSTISSKAGCLDSNTFDACDDPTSSSQKNSTPVIDRREQRLTNDNEHRDASDEEEKQDVPNPPKRCYSDAMTWPLLCIPDGINLLTSAYDDTIKAYSTPSLKAYAMSSSTFNKPRVKDDVQTGCHLCSLYQFVI